MVIITTAHPYLPNSAPHTRAAMLAAIGAASTEELFESIPSHLRMATPLNLPPALESEQQLQRHMNGLLRAVTTTKDVVSFLGHGCYPHYVPAICTEVNGRAEFLTAYAGEPYEDHGKWQAIFEYTSLMAELIEMDVVTVPTYDGLQAAATALRMAIRMTGRRRVLVSAACNLAMREKIASYLDGIATITPVPFDAATGAIDLDATRPLLTDDVAGILIQTPNDFGVVETDIAALTAAAHQVNTVVITSVDPISLGFLRSPAADGVDIVCGDIQSLGLGMHFGGAHGGYLAVHDEPRFVFELPSRLFGLAGTTVDGELGFTDVAYERTSLARREDGIEWVGTAAALWGITAGVYLASMGPHGMSELGDMVAAYTRYACSRLSQIDGVDVLFPDSPHWRELAVRYRNHTVAEVNAGLVELGIFGGADLSAEYPELGQVSLFCFTELTERPDIDNLCTQLEELLS